MLPDKVTEFVDALRALLAGNPYVALERTQLGVSSLTPAGMQVDLTCYLNVSSASEERSIRQGLMIDISTLSESMGVPPGDGHVPRALAVEETASRSAAD